MSSQAYIDSIERTTGKTPDDFRKAAADKGFLVDGGLATGVKATAITDWLKADYGLGHGHAMALYAILKGSKKEGDW